MKNTVFVVEDETALQELYTYILENEFECKCIGDSQSFFAELENQLPDIVVLDIMLPGEDGFSILSRLKGDNKTKQIPVVMVSAKGEEISKVKGLNMGADDYISKPFGVLEFIARIKSNLRKTSKGSNKNILYKDIFIDDAKHKIIANGNSIQTTLKEYNLLFMFCKNIGKVQGRNEIFKEVWGSDFVGETRTLDMHIKELRKKLAKANSEVTIETIRGVGYMLS